MILMKMIARSVLSLIVCLPWIGAGLLTYRTLGAAEGRAGEYLAHAAPAQSESKREQEIAKEKAKAQEQAKLILDRAAQSANDIQDDAQKAFALMNIATARADAGDRAVATSSFAEAVRVADSIQEQPREFKKGQTLMFIAKAQAEAGDVAAAIATATSITTRGTNSKDWALAHIASAQAKAGDVKGAMDTVDLIPDSGRAFALMLVSARQVEARDLNGASKTTELIQASGTTFKTEALATLAIAQAKAGDRAAAQKSIQLALESAKALEDRNPDLDTSRKAHALTFVARAHAETGDLTSALEIAETLKGSYKHDQVMASVALVKLKGGKMREALQIVDELGDGVQKSKVLREVISAHLKKQDCAAARKVIDRLLPMLEKSEALSEMAATCLKAGDQGGAADAFALAIQNVRAADVLYDENGQLCSGPFDLRLVVRARAEAGDEKGALGLADQTSPFVKAVALAGVAEGMARRKTQTATK